LRKVKRKVTLQLMVEASAHSLIHGIYGYRRKGKPQCLIDTTEG
jgi:hypothetical protein